jgi:mannose-6-phosphate isomerase-like protein (cupin superfamily)
MPPFNPQDRYVHLDIDGAATVVPGGEQFWGLPEPQIERYGHGWLVSEFECAVDWPNWEMHPEGDEFVYLLSGAVTLVLDQPGGPHGVALRGSGAVLVPRGVWHTAKVHVPSRLLHVTRGAGTQRRPA